MSYSWNTFRNIILVMIDDCYPEFAKDLESLYKAEVLVFSAGLIDKELYHNAVQDYIKFKNRVI